MVDARAFRKIRKTFRYSQADIGRELGFTGRVLSNIETGKRKFTEGEEVHLAEFFSTRHGVDLADPKWLPTEAPPGFLLKIVAEKRFRSIDFATMKEVTTHIEAIKNLVGGEWEVSCRVC